VKTLVIYLMAEPETPELARAAVEAGADVVELGFPFSDPLADGPVIRRAAERALARGMRTRQCLEVLARTRELVPDTPLVPMTYASLLEAYGWERFADDVEHGAVQTAVVVREDPQPDDLAREPRRLFLPVRAGDAEEDAEAGADLAARRDPRPRDALHHGTHRARSYSSSRIRARYCSEPGTSELASL